MAIGAIAPTELFHLLQCRVGRLNTHLALTLRFQITIDESNHTLKRLKGRQKGIQALELIATFDFASAECKMMRQAKTALLIF